MEAPSDNLAQLSTPLPRQSSAKSSNRLPEFASLQLNPAPKLSSPFQTPTTTTMDYHSDTSLESVEIRNSYSKGSAEATGVSDQVCESKDIVKNTILEDKCESRNGESKAVPKAAASKGPTLPAANGPEEPANVTSNTHSDDRAESLEDGQQTNEVHPASPSGPVILTLVPRTHTTPAEGHVDMTLTPIDGVGASISIAKDDGGLPQTPSSFPSEIGPAPACDRRLSLPDMNASAPVTGDQVSTEKAPAAESDEIPLTERPGVGGGGGSNGCEDAAAIGKEDSFSTEGRGRDMVPSYLRTQPPSSGRPFGSQASQNITTPEVVRTPEAPRYRSQYTPSYQQPIYRRDGDRDELPRLQAMLLKARQDLASERLINQNARITVEAETRQNVEAGFMSMLAEVLSKQAELVKQEALLKVRELDIQRRAEQVEQLEVFLAEGQKQLYRDLEERGGRPFNSVELEYARRQGQTDALSKFRGVEAKLEAKLQQLNVREAGLDFRERHYKAQIRDALETELREVLEVEVATRISEAEYGRGFTAGKRAGRAESDEEVRRDGFSQGYTACLETQERLKRLRAGQIPHDSPELDFLVDLSHPDNPLIRGVQIGRYEEARKKKKATSASESVSSALNAAPVTLKQHAASTNGNGVQQDNEVPKSNGVARSALDAPKTNGFARYVDGVPKLNGTTAPTPRFITKINGAGPQLNGHGPVTNGIDPCMNGSGSRTNGREGNGTYTSRRILHYEDSDTETVAPEPTPHRQQDVRPENGVAPVQDEPVDLIDLY